MQLCFREVETNSYWNSGYIEAEDILSYFRIKEVVGKITGFFRLHDGFILADFNLKY